MTKLEKVIKAFEICKDVNGSCYDCPYCTEDSIGPDDCDRNVFDDALELLKEREWISVKDRLPEKSGCVLTYRNGSYDVISFSKRWQQFNAYDMLNNADHAIDVSHWQSLPEPPKEGDGE